MKKAEIKSLIAECFKEIINEGYNNERRFRCSIYVDIWVPMTDDLEADREKAKAIAESTLDKMPGNAYVGGVGLVDRDRMTLDKEI